jgi:DnaJ-class molecular chaperone
MTEAEKREIAELRQRIEELEKRADEPRRTHQHCSFCEGTGLVKRPETCIHCCGSGHVCE